MNEICPACNEKVYGWIDIIDKKNDKMGRVFFCKKDYLKIIKLAKKEEAKLPKNEFFAMLSMDIVNKALNKKDSIFR